MSPTLPPGPTISLVDSLRYRFGRDPLGFLSLLAHTYGDLACYRVNGELIFFVNDPQAIKDILVTHSRNFTKSRGLERTKPLLGEGLLTSEGALHLRQRRLMQPAFHRSRVTSYAATMVRYAERLAMSWSDGATLDIAQEMARLTLSIAGKTLFDLDIESQAATVGRALGDVMESFWMLMAPFADILERLPFGRLGRARRARAQLDAMIYRMIAERRSRLQDRGDLLSMLLLAQDEDDGSAMSDRQVRDEAMTILLAGHETTANALAWTWYLLSEWPLVAEKLYAEVDSTLGGRSPSAADLSSLPFLERVVTESMRLYPPAWLVGRRAIEPYEIAGYTAPARTIFLMSQWVMQRDARYFETPERFDPDRWTPELKASLPKFAYFPFGGGPRQCIGEPFAWMELALVVASIAQRWRLRLVPGHPVVPRPLVTLRTRYGIRMTLERRPLVRR